MKGDALHAAICKPAQTVKVRIEDDLLVQLTADAASSQQRAVLRGHEKKVTHAVWSPDGRAIVTASAAGTARVWDAASGQECGPHQGVGYPRGVEP